MEENYEKRAHCYQRLSEKREMGSSSTEALCHDTMDECPLGTTSSDRVSKRLMIQNCINLSFKLSTVMDFHTFFP